MNPEKIKLVAFDLDGTLTQHKSKLGPCPHGGGYSCQAETSCFRTCQ